MSRQNRKGLKITTRGNFLGVKVNTSGAVMRDIFRKSGVTDRATFLARVMPIARQTMAWRVDVLRDNLVQGVTVGSAGSKAREVNMPVNRRVEGLSQMEMTSGRHEHARSVHTVHRSIPDILTRLARSGLSVVVSSSGDEIGVRHFFSNKKMPRITFHRFMDVTPSVATVARRLDETCLPFIQNGRLDDIVEAWAANCTLSILVAINKEFGL